MNTHEQGKVLVTGASGFLGRRIVKALVADGYSVRALVRSTSRVEAIRLSGVEFVLGDVADFDSLGSAFMGIDMVIHAAADTSGSEDGARRVTLGGTSHILDLCARYHIKKLVYISSCSVYGVADCQPGQVLDENSPLEQFPERRGAYSQAKLEAENLVTACMQEGKVAAVCLRPGTIYGRGGENYTPMLGFNWANKIFAVIDNKKFVLPLVYVDNLVQAICVALSSERSAGKIYNVVDPEHVGKRKYMDDFIRKLHPAARVFYISLGLLSTMVAMQEKAFSVLKCPPALTLYRLWSSQNPVVYDASRIEADLGWQSRVSFAQAVERIVSCDQH